MISIHFRRFPFSICEPGARQEVRRIEAGCIVLFETQLRESTVPRGSSEMLLRFQHAESVPKPAAISFIYGTKSVLSLSKENRRDCRGIWRSGTFRSLGTPSLSLAIPYRLRN